MSDHDLEPLGPAIKELLDAERARPGIPAEVHERLRARLDLSLPDGGGPGAGGGGTNGHAAGHSSVPSARGLRGWARLPRLLSTPLRLAIGTFAAGVMVGAGMHVALSPPPPAPHVIIVQNDPAALTPPPPALPEPAALVADGPMCEARATAVAAAAPPPRTLTGAAPKPHAIDLPGHDLDLASERARLETARTALGRGQSDAALALLERHARELPHARLAEERESLWVQALAAAGRNAEARERGERFRRRYPQSLLLPAVEAVLRSLP